MAGTVYTRTRCPKTGKMVMVNEAAQPKKKKAPAKPKAAPAPEAPAAE
jgi:hypothetical protein